MTGAPIYLVSACASGEEFVAAFRRYADKNGLFVPIREPLPASSRSRFAVTLKDGGVMIEGEAEVISSAPTPSVLHGRIGMTLRFLAPDDASKTVLGELEKARLSMRPAPPSVPPRPAEVPAEPRPVPPPPQGRIDAVNALAECVAIGDTSAFGPAMAAAPVAAPPKGGPRSVVPAVSAASGVASGVAPSSGRDAATATPPRTATSPSSNAIAKPSERDEHAEAIRPSIAPRAPRATPQPEPHKDHERRTDPAQVVATISGFSQTMTAVNPLFDQGPISETLTAATPPEPLAAMPSEPLAAMPSEPPAAVPSEPLAAMPSEPPAVLPATAFAKTLVGSPAATSPVAMPPAVDPTVPRRAVEMPAVSLPPITRQHAASSPAIPALTVPAPASPAAAAPAPVASVLAASAPAGAAPAGLAPAATVPAAAAPAGPAPAGPATATPAPAAPVTPLSLLVETARDGMISDTMTAVPIPGTMTPSSPTDIGAVLVEPLPPIEIVESSDEDLDPVHVSTHIGMPPIPRAATPASPAPGVVTPAPPIVASPRPAFLEVEIAEPTDISPGPPEPPAPEPPPAEPPPAEPPPAEPPPARDLTATAPEIPLLRPRKTALGVVVAPSSANVTPATEAATPAAQVPGLPSGDWAIALDPQAPDGWSEPFALISPEKAAGDPPPMPPSAVVASTPPRDRAPKRPTPRPEELPGSEPKVQIDPTLIAPHEPVSSDPPSIPFLGPHGQPVMHPGQVPDYPMNPSYQMVPIAGLPVPAPRSADSSGLGSPGYASAAALPVQRRRNHVVIILVSVLVAVAIGIVVLVVLRSKRDAGTPAGMDVDHPRVSPVALPNVPAMTPASVPAAPKPPAEPSAASHGDAAAVRASDPVAGTAPPGAGACFAEVSSVPAGAEIVVDQTHVIGTTPQKVTLPCGGQVDLVIRKGRLVPVTRTITPTPDGVKLKVALAKQMFMVKVSSTPAGATITMNGKSLGVTPTTVKIPAFEASTLTVAKDGFATETEQVTPRSNGVAVHTTLTKLERKKPR